MTLIRLGLMIAGIFGTIIPFIVAQATIAVLYPTSVTGLPTPLWVNLIAYTLALLIAVSVVTVCFKLIKKDRESTDKVDGLDERENLPY